MSIRASVEMRIFMETGERAVSAFMRRNALRLSSLFATIVSRVGLKVESVACENSEMDLYKQQSSSSKLTLIRFGDFEVLDSSIALSNIDRRGS